MLRAVIIGNLGLDAVMQTVNGSSFCSLSVAHTHRYKDSQGCDIKNVVWVSVIINWNAQKLLPYLVKGAKIYASGRLRTRIYYAKDGKPHCGVDIIADNIELCGNKLANSDVPSSSIDVTEGELNDDPF